MSNPDLDAAAAGARAAAIALEAHHTAFGLEDDQAATRPGLFHLLVSLLEWSDAQSPRVDFDDALSEARNHLAFRG